MEMMIDEAESVGDRVHLDCSILSKIPRGKNGTNSSMNLNDGLGIEGEFRASKAIESCMNRLSSTASLVPSLFFRCQLHRLNYSFCCFSKIFYIHKISCKVSLEDCCYPLVQCWNKTSVMGSCLVDSLWMRIVLIALGRQSLLISCCWYISTSIYLFFLPILLSCSLLY
ncbi:hypothetical protein EUGRSUZ_H01850 [Eucalyptus grandis]|uniref:Uncharacterized protein n=2 Tax=Eucalyptus grandis TaxID=71139 RepID=A0A059AYY1_EUCGR|nr:hypothetical protein EUGRSUZ_H01850 [Eucalyptus grandis]